VRVRRSIADACAASGAAGCFDSASIAVRVREMVLPDAEKQPFHVLSRVSGRLALAPLAQVAGVSGARAVDLLVSDQDARVNTAAPHRADLPQWAASQPG